MEIYVLVAVNLDDRNRVEAFV